MPKLLYTLVLVQRDLGLCFRLRALGWDKQSKGWPEATTWVGGDRCHDNGYLYRL